MLNIYSLIGADANASRPDWVVNSFPIVRIVIMSLLLLLSVAMIVLVVMQKSDQNGASAITGQSNTFYNRNKKTTLQGKIKNLTIVVAVVMMVLCVAFMIVSQIYSGQIA